MPEITLFFTAGMSLTAWEKAGLLERELALYRRYEERGFRVRLVTYGGPEDLLLRARLGGMGLLCNRFGLGARAYRLFLENIFPLGMRRGTVVKSNQMAGSDTAMRAARKAGARFVARCGYLLSDFAEKGHGKDSPEAENARTLERTVFSGADRVVLTTGAMRESVLGRYGLDPGKVVVIPNYVDTASFSPGEKHTGKPRVCFVGRLEAQKNPVALVRAMKGLGAGLTVVGTGPLEDEMRAAAEEDGVDVSFMGNVPNTDLPEILRSSSVFALPSFYEGHPKALIEAMACGLPVVGGDAPGIRGLVEDGKTGLLSGHGPEEIRSALSRLLSDGALSERLGRAAREHAALNFSLDSIAGREAAMMEGLLCG